jgi:CubicO group peptidase (beta-lactamase class C family)
VGALSRPLIREPGTMWDYENYDTLLGVLAMKRALGDEQTYREFPRRALLDKIGMRNTLAKIETSDALEFEFGLPLASVGLAPDLPAARPDSPLANDELVADLLAVDPRGGRQVLFEMDSVGYWDRFPLRPPTDGVVAAFGFPLPDLEGSR